MTPTGAARIELATAADADAMAVMSRDLIESGLGWSWTGPTITRLMRRPDVNAIVARDQACVAGFAIMEYHREHAHLVLLAVQPAQRRSGLASRLLQWLEATAVVAGIAEIRLELRAGNDGARQFYQRHGYLVSSTVPGYYRGREDALRMTHTLYAPPPGTGD